MRVLITALLGVFCAANFAVAAPASVTIKIGSDVGTSNDRAGRLLANAIGKYLPGTPAVAVENVPGASGARLAHQMVESEPRDGSVLGLVTTDIVRSHIVDPASMDFDPSTLIWVGALLQPVQLCVTSKDHPISLADLARDDVNFGATAKNSSTYAYSAMLRTVKNGAFKIVTGFKNELDMAAALDRGEIAGYCSQTYSTYLREDRAETQIILGGFGPPARLAELGIPDIAAGVRPEDAAAIDLLLLSNKAFYTFALPTGTPPELVQSWRAAFDAAMQDPALAADMQSQFAEFSPVSGSDVAAKVDAATAVDPAIVARARDIVK